MSNEIFRFTVMRPFQKKDIKSTRSKLIQSYATTYNSQFFKDLKQAKENKNREEMLDKAKTYREQDPNFVRDFSVLKMPLEELDACVFGGDSVITADNLAVKVDEIFKAAGIQNWKAWMEGAEYTADLGKLSDSLIACSIGITEDETIKKLRPKLVRGIRLSRLLERLKDGDKELQAKGAIAKSLTAMVLLPKQLFPLPPIDSKKEREEILKKYEEEKERIDKKREETFKLVGELEKLRNAIDDINIVHRQISKPEWEEKREKLSKDLEDEHKKASGGRGLFSSLFGRWKASDEFKVQLFTDKDTSWILTEKAVNKLSDDTKKTLADMNIDTRAVHVRDASMEIERKVSALSERLHFAKPKSTTVRVGNNFVAKGLVKPLVPEGTTLMQPAPGTIDVSVPVASDPPLLSAMSVPTGKGNVQPIGETDLYVAREHILRYEAGDVAHIENILRGERKLRVHKRTKEAEEILEKETEEIEESEHELQSTDRFELQTNSAKSLEQTIQAEAGVEATYSGVNFEVKADAGFSYERASQESKSKARNVVNEVIDKTVSRTQERVREQRVKRTRELIEERNLHEINNTGADAENVSGVYRWVNKIHRVDVVNYGRRLMFEFIVPEPSAFFRHAEANTDLEGVTMDKPEPPVYEATASKLRTGIDSMPLVPGIPLFGFNVDFADTEVRPLQPEDLNEDNYMHWVAKYNVRDAEPPPPRFKIFGLAVNEKAASTGNDVPKSVGELTVEDGYQAKSAYIGGTFIRHPNGYMRVSVGGHKYTTLTNLEDPRELSPLNDEEGKIPVTVVFYMMCAIGIIVEVTCERTTAKLHEWQLKTFGAIMDAYNNLKSQYEEQLAAAQIQAGIAIAGRNPLKNREIERTELKKASITIITGQHFDLFDAMRESAAPHKYPQMDIQESTAEGRYIQFFEQAFEWHNMSYIFYPYFWGRKKNWIDNLHLSDTDPKFEKFRQAGAARVLVPVRPGYEQAVLHYLGTETGEIWEGGDPPHVEDDLYVSIVDSIKEDQGHIAVEGKGEISVTNDSTVVTGTGTEFTEEDDENREIFIRGKRYLIARVEGTDTIHLQKKYGGTTETGVPYELGLQFVGEPWDVTIPTSLVWLQKDEELPKWKQDENGNWIPDEA